VTEITWYKRFHGTAFDPKFKAVAIEAGSTRCNALAVWDALLELSSDSDDRGTIFGLDARVIAAGLDLALEEVRRIWDGFVALGMIAGERIVAWVKRQGAAVKAAEKVLSTNATRVARHRQRKAQAAREPELPGLAASITSTITPVTAGVTAGVTSATDLESDEERIPPGPPPRGAPPDLVLTRSRKGLADGRQVEILMPIPGGRDDRRRRETSDERKMREFKEALARAGMAGRLARDRVAASAGG
jgi:hypothetical protein